MHRRVDARRRAVLAPCPALDPFDLPAALAEFNTIAPGPQLRPVGLLQRADTPLGAAAEACRAFLGACATRRAMSKFSEEKAS